MESIKIYGIIHAHKCQSSATKDREEKQTTRGHRRKHFTSRCDAKWAETVTLANADADADADADVDADADAAKCRPSPFVSWGAVAGMLRTVDGGAGSDRDTFLGSGSTHISWVTHCYTRESEVRDRAQDISPHSIFSIFPVDSDWHNFAWIFPSSWIPEWTSDKRIV